MNKTDLVKQIAMKHQISASMAGSIFDTTLESISEALSSGNDVALIGFGTFSTVKRPERTGRNPKTGEQMTIPAKNVVRFKPGKKISESVNK